MKVKHLICALLIIWFVTSNILVKPWLILKMDSVLSTYCFLIGGIDCMAAITLIGVALKPIFVWILERWENKLF